MAELRVGNDLDVDAVIAVYTDSTLGARRPVGDRDRMAAMLAHNSAWTLPSDSRLAAT